MHSVTSAQRPRLKGSRARQCGRPAGAPPSGPTARRADALSIEDSERAVDLDSLISGWRLAFTTADAALAAGRHDLSPTEHRARAQRLTDERRATVTLLDGLARQRNMKPYLVRLVASPREAKRLLGLPPDTIACVFNVDGVLIPSAAIHAQAWRATLDAFMATRTAYAGAPLASFSVDVDYPRLIHGKTRLEGVRAFLASRGISLPEGAPDDAPGTKTLNALANRKNEVLLDRLAREALDPFEGSRLYLELAHDAHLPCAVVSGSTNASTLLERARLADLIDECVDGNTVLAEGLERKPAPDMLLAACRRLGAEPARTVVFETTIDGMDAARAGGFRLAVAVDQERGEAPLRAHGADIVVPDLGDLLARQLGAPGA